MSDTLVIRCLDLSATDTPQAQWLLVDAQGGRLGAMLQGTLSEAMALAGGRDLIMLVPGADAVHLEPVLPPLKYGAKLQQMLPFALEDQLASDVDALHFAVGKREHHVGTPVTVVSHDAMQRWLMPLRQAGIQPTALYVDHALMPTQAQMQSVLIDRGQVSVRRDGQPLCTLDAAPLSAALATLIPADEHAAVTIYIAESEYDAEQPAIEAVRERVGSCQVKLLPEGVLPLLALNAVQNGATNLLQGPYARRTELGKQFKPWRFAAMLLGALAITHLAVQGVRLWQLRKQETRLDMQIQQTYAMGMAGGVINANEARAAFESRLIAAQNATRGSGLMMSLDALAGALNQTPTLQIEALAYRNDNVEVRLFAPTMESLEQIRQQAQTRNMSAEIASAAPKDDQIEGHLQFKLPPGA